jgi:hypothetical protein
VLYLPHDGVHHPISSEKAFLPAPLGRLPGTFPSCHRTRRAWGRSFPVEPIASRSITPSRFELSDTFLALAARRRVDRRASVAPR